MFRLVIFALLIWVAYHIVKKVAKDYLASLAPRQRPEESVSEAELIRDPQCGAYFMKQQGVKGVMDGKVIHFCSQQCYDNYLKSRNAK